MGAAIGVLIAAQISHGFDPVSGLRVIVAGSGANIFPTHRRGLDAIGAEVVGVHDVGGVAINQRQHARSPS